MPAPSPIAGRSFRRLAHSGDEISAVLQGYRPEIDGLRAVAIVPVVLYHAGFGLTSGGYVGVDVFFVISGYLITRILADDIARGRFSIFAFYERRIRRIFPALFTVLAASSAIAFWLLLAPELKDFGESLVAATLFLSNHYFMGDTGYFGAPAETKPLLHLWSLAVEEQFYILFPIYLFLMTRHYRERLIRVTAGLLVVSLAANIALTFTEPDAAFYLAPTRAWELLLGSMLALWSPSRSLSPRPAQLMSIAGLLMIGAAVFSYTDATTFPGIAALLPVAGAALVIYAADGRQVLASRLLSLPPIRFIGLISYSLYLWHWPLLVFYRLWRIEPPAPEEIAGVVALSIVLSIISWHVIERPFRTRALLPTWPLVLRAGGLVMAAGVVAGMAFALGDGFGGRYPADVARILAANEDRPGRTECERVHPESGRVFRICPIGAKGEAKPSFAVWGDSHAEALLSGFGVAAAKTGRSGVFLGRVGCPPLLGVDRLLREEDACGSQANAIIGYIAARPEIGRVILAARWAHYATGEPYGRERDRRAVLIRDSETTTPTAAENRSVFERGLSRTIAALRAMGREVLVVTQVPETEFDIPLAMARARWLGWDMEFRPTLVAYRERQALVTSLLDAAVSVQGIKLASIAEALCQGERCSVAQDGIPVYFDSNHLTRRYAQSLAGLWVPFLSGSASASAIVPTLDRR